MSSVFAAREGRYAASEEIRLLQQRKADASVRVAGERLRCAAVLVPFFLHRLCSLDEQLVCNGLISFLFFFAP